MVAKFVVRTFLPPCLGVISTYSSPPQCAIGVLNRADMVNFATIFVNFQKRGNTKDPASMLDTFRNPLFSLISITAIKKLDEMLAVWTSPDAPGKKRVTSDETPFSIKSVFL
jgi:hypothetical protein